jgi:hypothetical protein
MQRQIANLMLELQAKVKVKVVPQHAMKAHGRVEFHYTDDVSQLFTSFREYRIEN